MPRLRSSAGQASVELVALLPVLAAVAALLWQAVLAGQAVWLAQVAAGRAARAASLGPPDPLADARTAARAALPARLARGAAVRLDDGLVHLRVPVPAVLGGGSLTRVGARARVGEP